MKLLRFISKDEFNVLNRDKKVKPTNKGRAWDGKKRLYAFPLGYYPEEEYFKIKEYLEVAYDIDYDYAVYIDNGHEEYVTFAAYDKEMLEMTVGRKVSFDIDEDAYDSGPVYVVPEVRLVEYSLDDVEKVVSINSNFEESDANSYDNYMEYGEHELHNEGSSLVFYYDEDGFISIDTLKTDDDKRNKGYATDLIKRLIDIYKDENIPIYLTIVDDWGDPKDKLINFYKKLGFKEENPNWQDNNIVLMMYDYN